MMGPNHKPECDGKDWYHSGEGYNRVKVCKCGAEDHDPSPGSLEKIIEIAKKFHEDTIP